MPGDNHLRIHVNADGVVEFSVALDDTVDPSILANMVAAVRRGIVNDSHSAAQITNSDYHFQQSSQQNQYHHNSSFNHSNNRRTKDDVDLRQYHQPPSHHHNLALTKAKSTASQNPHPNLNFNNPLHNPRLPFTLRHNRTPSPVVEQNARNLSVRQIAAEFEEGLCQSRPNPHRSPSPTRHDHSQQTTNSPQNEPRRTHNSPLTYDNVREFSSSPTISLQLNNQPVPTAPDNDAKLRPQSSGHSLAPLVSTSLAPQRSVQRLAFTPSTKSARFKPDPFLPASLKSQAAPYAQHIHPIEHVAEHHIPAYQDDESALDALSFARVVSHSHPPSLDVEEDISQHLDPIPGDSRMYPDSRRTDPIVDDATVAAASTVSSRSSGLPHIGRVTSRSASLQHMQSSPTFTSSALALHTSSQSVGATSNNSNFPHNTVTPSSSHRHFLHPQDEPQVPLNELADVTSRVTGRHVSSKTMSVPLGDYQRQLPDDEAAVPIQERHANGNEDPPEDEIHAEDVVDADDPDNIDGPGDPNDAIAAASQSESPSASSALILTRSALAAASNAGDALVAEDDEPVDERVRRVTEIPFVAPRDLDELPDGEENWDSVEYVVSDDFHPRGFSQAADRDSPPAGADIHAGSMTRVARWRLLSSIGSRVVVRKRLGGDGVEDIHQGTLAEGSPVYSDEKSSSATKMARRYIPLLFTRSNVKNGASWCEFSSPLGVEQMLVEIGRISKSLGYQVWRRQGENKLRCIRRLSHRHEMHMIIVVGTISLPEGPLTTVKLRRARSDRNRTDPWRYVHFNRELIERLQRKGVEVCGGE